MKMFANKTPYIFERELKKKRIRSLIFSSKSIFDAQRTLKLREGPRGSRNAAKLHKGKIQAHFFPLFPLLKK